MCLHVPIQMVEPGTDILLAAVSSLLVVDNCPTIMKHFCAGVRYTTFILSPAHTEPFMHSSHFKMLRRSGHVRREGIY